MVTSSINQPENNIYPGIYTPSGELNRLAKEIHKDVEDINEIPSICLDEFTDHYLIEASLPGVPRENIFIQVHDEVITVIIKDAALHIPTLHFNKIDTNGCAFHSLRMPGHIETGFISASFRKGLLRIYIPKSSTPCEIADQDVVIY